MVRGFDSKDNVEFPAILLNLEALSTEVSKDESSKVRGGAGRQASVGP